MIDTSQPVAEAIERGYLVLHRQNDTLLNEYYRQARDAGQMFVILRLRRGVAHVEWNGDEIDNRARREAFDQFSFHDAAPQPRYAQHIDTDSLADLLKPVLCRARSRHAMMFRGGYYGCLNYVNAEDGVPTAEMVTAWFRERLPAPESHEAWYARRSALRKPRA